MENGTIGPIPNKINNQYIEIPNEITETTLNDAHKTVMNGITEQSLNIGDMTTVHVTTEPSINNEYPSMPNEMNHLLH